MNGYAQSTLDGLVTVPTGVSSAAPLTDQVPAEAGPVTPVANWDGANALIDPQGEIGTLLALLRDPQLKELRTVYHGDYGASLFLYAPSLTYYVALFQNKRLWRVIPTWDTHRAEAIFRRLADQSKRLATSEIEVAIAAARKKRDEQQIALLQARMYRQQADLAVERQQSVIVTQRQRAATAQLNKSRVEQDKAQEQLRVLRERAGQLQHQLEKGLR
ncbi:DUF2968 domain-containing protein [Burkholderia lata]|uniref:DUF2968 domain-containing protein n=1 Tax=Burkholderia lata (strain ATCC 17760 / DSM 23089 / LMG 22485 / NCIMB 9086 / R18194 / 383) TaxID=482957 RepID=UPI0015816754|nr:DUF2968 domain-containing protein [Burkholderia lata]